MRQILAALLLGSPAHATEPERLLFEGGGERLALHVRDSEAVFMHGQPSLHFMLDAEGAVAVANLTGSMIGETLTVSLCGRVLVEAIVRERISGGRGMVNLPTIETAIAAANAMKNQGTCAELEAVFAE